jgi:hypothetical protein
MALAAASTRDRRESGDISEPGVAANAIIFQGGLVCYNAAGFLVPASDTAGLSTCAGVALADADNTGGANGAITCRYRSAVYVFTDSAAVRAIAVTDRQALCYATDDDNVQISGTGNMPIAGIIEDVDASGVWVRVDASRTAAATDDALTESGPVFEVRGASTADVPALATFTVAGVDGLTYVAGERILLKDQTAPAENGIYVVGTVAGGVAPLTRALDADGNDEIVAGMMVLVSEGTAGLNTAWHLDTNDPVTVGTTALVYTQRLFGFGLAGTIANVDGAAAAAGTQLTAARADHKHSLPAAVAPADTTKAAAVAGVSNNIARQDHKHDISTAATAALAVVPGSTAAEGAATSLARSDHVHTATCAATAALAVVPGAAAAEGAAATFARSDHVHTCDCAAAGALAIGSAAAEGAAATFARSDHAHAITAAVAPEDVDNAAAAAGVSTDFAAADHKHDISATSGLIVQYRNYQYTNADLTAAGITQTINHGAALPANSYILAWSYDLVDAFDNGASANLDVTLGFAADDDCICSAFDAFTGSANEGVTGGGTAGVGSFGYPVVAGGQLITVWTLNADQLQNCTNGDLTITVFFTVIP